MTSPTGATTYAWDPLGHLTSVSSATATATYAYGISGMRESKTVTTASGAKETQSVWDGQLLAAERDSDGTLYRYLWGPERTPLALEVTRPGAAAALYSYHTDAQGSVVALTRDGTGAIAATYAYDAFGRVTHTSGSEPALASRNPLRYRSYYLDAETGLYYLPARYYDPATARFLSPDPAPPQAGDPLSLNAYAYCQGDPMNKWDPSGAIVDWDGNGKTDSWDTAMHNAGLTKDPVKKAQWEAKANTRHTAAIQRVAMALARQPQVMSDADLGWAERLGYGAGGLVLRAVGGAYVWQGCRVVGYGVGTVGVALGVAPESAGVSGIGALGGAAMATGGLAVIGVGLVSPTT